MEQILQHETLRSLELQQRQYFLNCLPTVTDDELIVWMLVESNEGIFHVLNAEWLTRHPEC